MVEACGKMKGLGLVAVDGFDRVRQPEFQEPVGGVEDVRPPVAEGPVAVVEPPAPGQRVQPGAVRMQRPRAVPEVPVEARRHRLAGRVPVDLPAVPAARAVHEHDDLRHVGDDAGLCPRLELEVVVPRVALVAHLGDHARAGGHGDEEIDFAERVRQRLLDVDVLAGGHGVHGQRESACGPASRSRRRRWRRPPGRASRGSRGSAAPPGTARAPPACAGRRDRHRTGPRRTSGSSRRTSSACRGRDCRCRRTRA